MPHWNTANPNYYSELKTEVKRLKTEMTNAETILWNGLKSKKLSVKFRRQHMIDKFIPDFVSLPIKLVVEVDGSIHKSQKNYDEYRTLELGVMGYKVIRFTNEEVLSDVDGVLRRIKEVIINMTPPNLPADNMEVRNLGKKTPPNLPKGEAYTCSNLGLAETKSELGLTMPNPLLGFGEKTPPNLPKGEALPCSDIGLSETEIELVPTMQSPPLGDLGGQTT